MYNNVGMNSGVGLKPAYDASNISNAAAATSTTTTAAKIDETLNPITISDNDGLNGPDCAMVVELKEKVIYCLPEYEPGRKSYFSTSSAGSNHEIHMKKLLEEIPGAFTVSECGMHETTYYRSEQSGRVSFFSENIKNCSQADLNKLKALPGTGNFQFIYKRDLYNVVNTNKTAATTSTITVAARINETLKPIIISDSDGLNGPDCAMKVDLNKNVIYCLREYDPERSRSYCYNSIEGSEHEIHMKRLLEQIPGAFTVSECGMHETTYYRSQQSGRVSIFSVNIKNCSQADLNKLQALPGTRNFTFEYVRNLYS